MHDLPSSLRVILIGGTSHAGKSTLAQSLAAVLGWEYRTTDELARHPGRPWRTDGTAVPGHVAEHYATLSPDELMADVLRHYEKNIFPKVEALVHAHASDPTAKGLVLEGSALWPEFIAPLASFRIATMWLTADDELLRQRINTESHYLERPAQEQFLIEKFLERTLVYSRRLNSTVIDRGLLSINVRAGDTVENLAQKCLEAIASNCHGAS